MDVFMKKTELGAALTRRDLLRMSSAGVATGAALCPEQALGASQANGSTSPGDRPEANANLYSELLTNWCDGMVARQVTAIHDRALYGGILCPACALIHGRCADAVYPLLRVARTTGEAKYLDAALLAYEWSEQVSRPDGSWVNDVNFSSWKGITVFHTIALAEAIKHHGSLLDNKTRQRWTERVVQAAKFLDGFMNIETGNINYPVTSAFCFAVVGQMLQDSHYLDRARRIGHEALDYFTPNGFLVGEGHPLNGVTVKRCRPVDLGYNVEESLPSLAMYALVMDDKPVLEQVIVALRTHMEFMLPDGAWDNSWGTRNYKWSWWGSRTSDGCHPAYVLLAQFEPRFREAALRNLELMAACSHDGLLYGGPHYFAHDDLPCIHHTFTHAKALATVLDRGGADVQPSARLSLPRDEPYGLKTYPENGTRLASIGDWRATVTEYDWDYVEHVQAGGGSAGGHVTGGALSMLFHYVLGPVLTASMTQYQLIEMSNQQVHQDYPHMELTPRVECSGDRIYSSVTDFEAALAADATSEQIVFNARGRLMTPEHQPAPGDGIQYHLIYRFSEASVEVVATADGNVNGPLRFILPVISLHDEAVERIDSKTVQIVKRNGKLLIRTDSARGFEALPEQRTFNLVPGFEAVPLVIAMSTGDPVRIELWAEGVRSRLTPVR
jgi:hypothetical protein